jgi:hypothetical protein
MFRVLKAFYLPDRDLLVFTGSALEGQPVAGMELELPLVLRGPGWVPVHSVEAVRFADGHEDLALTVAFHHLESAPVFEPSTCEGRVLQLRRRD